MAATCYLAMEVDDRCLGQPEPVRRPFLLAHSAMPDSRGKNDDMRLLVIVRWCMSLGKSHAQFWIVAGDDGVMLHWFPS